MVDKMDYSNHKEYIKTKNDIFLQHSEIAFKKYLGSVRLGKVVYSSGCESRSSKEGQPLDREPWVGGSNSKD